MGINRCQTLDKANAHANGKVISRLSLDIIMVELL